MRLKSIELEAFRVFAETTYLDLDASVVLLSGRNGFGKTSIFDGISWCLFGSSRRFEGSRDFRRAKARFITNVFRQLGEERVRLIMAEGDQEVRVERTGSSFSLLDGDEALDGESAELRLLEILGFVRKPDETRGSLQKRARDSFSRSFLLHQDLLSDFLTLTNPRDRFNTFADLFSLSPIREFYTHLSSERRRARDEHESAERQMAVATAELNQLRRQLGAEQDRIDQVAQESSGASRQVRADQTRAFTRALSAVRDLIPDFKAEGDETLNELDRAALALSGLRSMLDETLSLLRSLKDRVPLLSAWEEERANLERQITNAIKDVQSKEGERDAAQAALENLRGTLNSLNEQIEAAESARERLNAFLSDAIEFVESDECPVCRRPIRRDALLSHLSEYLKTEDPQTQARLLRRRSVTSDLQNAEDRRRQAAANFRDLEEIERELSARRDELHRRIGNLNRAWSDEFGLKIPKADAQQFVEKRLASIEERLELVNDIRRTLDDLRPRLELLENRQRLTNLQPEVEKQGRLVDARRESFDRYGRVMELLDNLITSSRKAERALLEGFVRQFRDPIENAYRWLSPHPLFRRLDFEFGDIDEAGELYFEVSRAGARLNPATTFSAAQANALALAVFLSLNASQDWSPLEVALIDDPVQSLDDLNVLRLVDLIRNTTGRRQLVLSTSVEHMARLFSDKLRPVDAAERLVRHHFEALTEEGPTIRTETGEYRPEPRILPELIRRSA